MVKRRWLAGTMAIALISAAAARSPWPCRPRGPGVRSIKADAVALTLTGKDGTVKTYTVADLKARTTADQGFYQGYAGFLDSAGNATPMRARRRHQALVSGWRTWATTARPMSGCRAIDGYLQDVSPQVMQGQGIVAYSDVAPYPQTTLPAALR